MLIIDYKNNLFNLTIIIHIYLAIPNKHIFRSEKLSVECLNIDSSSISSFIYNFACHLSFIFFANASIPHLLVYPAHATFSFVLRYASIFRRQVHLFLHFMFNLVRLLHLRLLLISLPQIESLVLKFNRNGSSRVQNIHVYTRHIFQDLRYTIFEAKFVCIMHLM